MTSLRTALVVLFLAGCADDGPAPAGTDGPGSTNAVAESSTTAPAPTTMPPMTTGATDTTDGTPMTDDGVDTTGMPSTDTGMTTGSETGTGTTGDTAGDAYGPCVTDDDCLRGEICLVHPNGPTVCAQTACTEADDCGMPGTGDAFVTCSELLFPDERTYCWLDCTAAAACPDGMVCVTNVCGWPAPAICGSLAGSLTECDETAGGIMPIEGALACDPADLVFFFDIYEIDVNAGDCVFVSADNVGAEGPTGEPAANLVAYVVDEGGDVAIFDDELDCSDPTFGGDFGCPQGGATAVSTGTMQIGIAQHGGEGCPDPAPYTLTVGANGADVDPGAPAVRDQDALCPEP